MKLNSIIIVLSSLVLVIAFWNRNAIPSNIELTPGAAEEPVQSPTRKRPFEVLYEDTAYRVRPQYSYVLEGLVVSYRHHDGNSRMHKRSGDHLNMLDVCVVWGSNADPALLRKLKFWNGIFTCNVHTRDRAAWNAFDLYALSNNHLISDRPGIRDAVLDLRIGDQIRVAGWLASYGTGGGGERGTSTTRKDTGDGACETIYVEEFAITRAGLSYWRIAMWSALAVLLVSLFIHFRAPYRPHAKA
ncbi:MAG: hypothetical protein AAGE85_14545 [Pseudomonadota bacterium]